MGEYVRLEVDDGVGVVRLDRPPANAIDLQLGLELQEAIREAAEALALGLTHRIEPADEVFDAAVRDARTFANGPRKALGAAKAAIRAAVETPGPAGIAAERALFLQLFGTPDQREGMRAFLDKRDPRFGAPAS